MYVTSKMANRWKEIHWLQIDKRCWEATYGPNSRGSAHLREAKNGDREPWPEWMGEKPSDHHDNKARETARKELELDLIIPDYTEIVGATVSHRMSIATEAIMAHLSNFIFLSHARLKAEQCSVGRYSPQVDRGRADDYVRRAGDQIEVVQYIRGRIGEDRSTVLDMGRIPDYHTRRWMPSALSKGKEKDQSEHAARTCALEPALKLKRARKSKMTPQRSPSTVIDKKSFSPLTGSDRGYSDTSEDEGAGPSNAAESSDYSPVSRQ
jgi:hypothetical protein